MTNFHTKLDNSLYPHYVETLKANPITDGHSLTSPKSKAFASDKFIVAGKKVIWIWKDKKHCVTKKMLYFNIFSLFHDVFKALFLVVKGQL